MNNKNVTCKFCILNMLGLMDVVDVEEKTNDGDTVNGAEVKKPIFCNSNYTIRTSLNSNYGSSNDNFGKIDGVNYQNTYKKRVLWDFGDGTKKEGHFAEHSYTKPGRYKITCTFFDINRRAYDNNYFIYVIVKEVIPTHLSFDEGYSKESIYCSKIESVARIQAFLSSTIKEELKIRAERIDENSSHPNYKSLPNNLYKFMMKYWCFLEDQNQIYYRTDEVNLKNMIPISYYTPKYDKIYGKFRCINGEIELLLYQVIPYYETRKELNEIEILNPNSDVSFEEENIIKVRIKQVYTQEQLPDDVIYIGKRAIVDIFYKSDFVGSENNLMFFYDIEQTNITGELESSPNYINMIPITKQISVIKNDINEVKVAISPDGFIKYLNGDNDIHSVDGYCVDKRFEKSLYCNFNINGYLFPYIVYSKNDVVNYYVPKDVSITCLIDNENSPNDLNSVCVVDELFEHSQNWFKQLSFDLKSIINVEIGVNITSSDDGVSKPDTLQIKIDKELKNVNDIIIPKEKRQKENINRLLDVYMSHPMWDETPNMREMLYQILNNKNYLNNMLSDSVNFLDNTQNVKTCYISNLISILQMMGEDISVFEQTLFDGNNDLKGFTRLLSMNHSELIGHEINSFPQIRITSAGNGDDVGKVISSDLPIELNENDKIYKIDGKTLKEYNCNSRDDDAAEDCEMIVRDQFSKDTWVVSLHNVGKKEFSISEYQPHWQWGLLLPSEFSKIEENIQSLVPKIENRAYSQTEKQRFKDNIQELKNAKRKIIDTYYSFYTMRRKIKNERIGNFMDELYITEDVKNTSEWNSKWGIVHETLMKILMTNCDLIEGSNG